MNFECLQTFIVLSQCKNFTRASEIMYVAQSTISNRIRLLEEYTKCQLVIRNKTGIELTEEGTLFLQYAKQLLNVETVALREIHMLNMYRDHLNVACAQWIHDCWFADDMACYSRNFPDIAVNMTVDHGETLISMMHNSTLDLAITAYNINTNSLVSRLYKKSKVVLVEKKEQYSYLQKGIRGKDLLGLPLIYSDIWENYLSDISEHLLLDERVYRIHYNMLGSAKSFCIAGLGCCFLPADLVKHELETDMLVEIPIDEISARYVDLFVTYNRDRLQSTAMKSFFELFPQIIPD
ncbi:MAG: LysR family transcriptional regulator [Clostridia bacterium]|nr:LysR family transcriptional regulator [Clostridia bacterium]